MLLYIFVAIFPLWMMTRFNALPLIKQNERRYKILYLFLASLPLFLMIGLRNELMGSDTLVYMRHFSEMRQMSLSEAIESTRMEIGYIYFVKIISYITPSPKVFQLICSTIYMLGVLSFATNLKDNDGFLFLYFFCTLGLFFFFFTGIRQCLAISICLFSYNFLIRKRYIVLLLFIALAYCFHKSALLFLFMLLVWNNKLKWYNYVIYIIALIIVSHYLLDVQMWVNENFDYDYEIEDARGGTIFLVILSIFSLISLWVINNRLTNTKSFAISLFNSNIITLFFWFLRLQTRVAERPSYFFMAFSCALFAHAVNHFPNYNERKPVQILMILIAMLLYIYRLSTNFAVLVPYLTF